MYQTSKHEAYLSNQTPKQTQRNPAGFKTRVDEAEEIEQGAFENYKEVLCPLMP